MKTINLKSYEITLFTVEECEQYKDRIPLVNDWWWLRSPGFDSNFAVYVYCNGSIYYNGNYVYFSDAAIRPVLKSSAISHLRIGDSFIALGNRWVMIDYGVAISKDVITHMRYDPVRNVWETSELKQWLEQWAKEGESEC